MEDKFTSNLNRKIYFDGTYLDNRSGIGRDARNTYFAAQLVFGTRLNLIYPKSKLFSRQVTKSTERNKGFFQKMLRARSALTGKPDLLTLDPDSIFIQCQLSHVIVDTASNTKWIVRLHDIFPITNPSWFRFYSRRIFAVGFWNSINRAVFICDSITTKNSLLDISKNIETRTFISPCPVSLQVSSKCEKCNGCNFSTPRDYIVNLGTLEPRKNHLELLEAWERSSLYKNGDFGLVIIGRRGWKNRKIRRKLRKLRKSANVYWLNYCCDARTQEIVRHAKSLVSNSLNEGFNLPIAESLIQKTPVLATDIPVHREIYGGAIDYYKSGDVFGLSTKLKLIFEIDKKTNLQHRDLHLILDYEQALGLLAETITKSIID